MSHCWQVRRVFLTLILVLATPETLSTLDFIEVVPLNASCTARASPINDSGSSCGAYSEMSCLRDPGLKLRLSCMCIDGAEEKLPPDTNDCLLDPVPEPEMKDVLEYCGEFLECLGYSLTIPTNATVVRTCSEDASLDLVPLSELRRSISEGLRRFNDMLGRTIVGVYLKTCEQRQQCWEAYVQWLCSTQLPLFTLNEDNCSDCSANCTTSCLSGDGQQLFRVRPNLGLCHNVLQRCPYYLPSEYQPSTSSDEIIYGGYPAFDCPRVDLFETVTVANCSDGGPRCVRGPPSYCRCGDSSHCCVQSLSSAAAAAVLHVHFRPLLLLAPCLLCLWFSVRTSNSLC